MKLAVGNSNKACLAGLKMAGYIPWNDKANQTWEGLQYDDGEEEIAEREDPHSETTKQKIRKYLKIGGMITSQEFFEAIKE